jgi:hypothetical protein
VTSGRTMTSADKPGRLPEGQVRILKLIAKDNPGEETLAALTRMVAEREPAAVARVTIVDRAELSLEMALFPSVPASWPIPSPEYRWGLPMSELVPKRYTAHCGYERGSEDG